MADALARKEISAVEVTQAHLDRIAAVDGDGARLPARRRRGRARRRPRAVDAAPRRRRGAARRWPACRSRSRTCSPPRACRPPAARGSSRAGSRRTTRPSSTRLRDGRHADPRQDQHGRVRDGLLHRALRLRPDPQPVGPRPDPRRLRRRLARPRSPRSRRRWRSAPTPAARSASPPPSPAPSASSRPTAGSPATASSRSPSQPRPGRPGAPAPCSTPRCCTRSSAGTTRWTPPRSTRRCPPVVEAARRARRRPGVRIGVVKELGGEGYQPGVQRPLRRGGRSCSSTPAPRSSRCPARASTTRWPPTT